MRDLISLPSLLVSLCLSGLIAAQEAAPTTVATPLADVLADLADHSSWVQDARYEGENPDKSARGVYPVGNGRVFGYLGLGARANTMQGVSGPTYQTAEVFAPKGHFGEHTLELVRDGKVVELPEQHVRRVRGANFVVSVDEDPKGLSLRTLSFAPADGTQIVRVVEVENRGTTEVAGATLNLRVDPSAGQAERGVVRVGYDKDGRRCHARFWFSRNGAALEGSSGVELPSLAPNATWQGVLTIATAAGTGNETPGNLPTVEAIKAAERTLAWWHSKLADTLYFDTDHRKLRDLVQDWKVMMLVQRDAISGAVSPMVNYRGCWVRDSVGPLLAFLRFNMWQEAKDILVYLHSATRLLDRVPNHVPLDLDFSKLEGKLVDWDKVEVPASEVPSWIVLMHFWYWRVTRDHALIAAHKPLLQRCLTGQRRVDQVLLPFHGDETWMHGAFYSLYPDRVGDGRFIADDQWQGRSTFSFASAVQYLLCIQAIGELENGLEEANDPDAYAATAPQDRPGQRYLTSSFKFMQELEQKFWIPDLGMFAPALSPVNRAAHRQAYADANLMPLWLGWTFPTGEKSRDNLKSTLAALWLKDARVGQTPTTGYACGHTQAKLVVALTERDAKNRLDSVDALLQMAEPAGEWGEVYDERGRPIAAYDAQWPNRCRPWESGINLDALFHAISGVRFVTVPNFDARDIRAKLRLPHGATYVGMRNVRKDGRDLNLYWRETFEKMTEKERTDNQEKAEEKRLDPEATHRRLRFRVDLNSANPKLGYYDVGLNAACTLFVRYLSREAPLDEVEYWADDSADFLPTTPTKPPTQSTPIAVTPGVETLYLSNRGYAGDLVRDDSSVLLIDTGLPITAEDLAMALVSPDGKKRVDKLFIDWRALAPGRTTFKAASFWTNADWERAQQAFTKDGGKILHATFVTKLALDGGNDVSADQDGRFAVPVPAGEPLVGTAVVTADAAHEVVLRIGSNTDVQVTLNDTSVLEHKGHRHPLPDQDSILVRLQAGKNTLRFSAHGQREAVLYARLTDVRGLPIDGVQ